jgi:hypothetical protein
LWDAHRAFATSRNRKGAEVQAEAIATAGSVAQHGFLDLAPVLVAALTGTDGGNLTWLGVAHSTKDFMHFELRKGDRSSAGHIDTPGY